MTDQQHPIAPPLEMVEQWADMLSSRSDHAVFSHAAQWGADQELEACCGELRWRGAASEMIEYLRKMRRPKPLTLAEQATADLDDAVMRGDCITTTDAMPVLRAALARLAELEALPND
jgi:hypothetical protein